MKSLLRKVDTSVWMLFVLFAAVFGSHLTTLPSLMGDEGSEGENVYQLLQADSITLMGERSYIGVLIDYVRVPFVWLLGYTTLAIRLPMYLFMVATFWLAAYVLKKLLPPEAVPLALVGIFFSPIFLTHQRFAWAASLFPFFVFFVLFFIWREKRNSPLFAGLAAGFGLANHILFLPTLVGLAASVLARGPLVWRKLMLWWPALVGFWAGFAVQAVMLLTQRDDQGDIEAATELVSQRWHDLPLLLPHILSGSSFVAQYTGQSFSYWVMNGIMICLGFLVMASLLVVRRRPSLWLSFVWLVVYVPALLWMIDRFSLRYFVMLGIWVWMMAGIGLAELVRLLPIRVQLKRWLPVGVAVGLSSWMVFILYAPYFSSGGSTGTFSLGNRVDSSSALVDTRPLLRCIAGKGPIFSENVHIYNRLLYLSHSDGRLLVASEDDKGQAKLLVSYRLPADATFEREGELCPELEHFKVTSRN
ncbi:MAG: hypothetical protein HYZ62_01685 [Candidatus Andersenbacteria bacterium]|nr:hypothetical protein [Candidatus Andersenbacteria bacterium]